MTNKRITDENDLKEWAKNQKTKKKVKCKYAIGRNKISGEILCPMIQFSDKKYSTANCSVSLDYLGSTDAGKGFFSSKVYDVYNCNFLDYPIPEYNFEKTRSGKLGMINWEPGRESLKRNKLENKKEKAVAMMLPNIIRFKECSQKFIKFAYALAKKDLIEYFDKEIEEKVRKVLEKELI